MSSTAATRGRPAAKSSPVIASGTVTASMRPSAIGPSTARNPTHHHAAMRLDRESRALPMRIENAMASSTVTIASHVWPYHSAPRASAAVIGANARIG